MFGGRNTPSVRPASPLCAGSLSDVRAPVSWYVLMPLQRSPCLGPGVRHCTVLALRALLAAHARVRPASVGCRSSTTVPRCDGSVSRSAAGLRPVPPKCSFVHSARCGRPVDRGRVRIAPPRHVASKSYLAASMRGHPRPVSECGARGSRFEGGTRTSAHVSAHPSSVLHDIRGALRGRHSSVSAPPCHGVRGALYALRASRARVRPPPPRHTVSALCSLLAARTRVRPP